MTFTEWLLQPILARLTSLESSIQALRTEVGTQMSTANEVISEVSTKVDAVSALLTEGLTEVTELINQLIAGAQVDPALAAELQAKLEALTGQAQTLADVVPDPELPVDEPVINPL